MIKITDKKNKYIPKLIRINTEDEISDYLIQVLEEEFSKSDSFNFGMNFFNFDSSFYQKLKSLQKDKVMFDFSNVIFHTTIGFGNDDKFNSWTNLEFRKKIICVINKYFKSINPVVIVPSQNFPHYYDIHSKDFTGLDLLFLDISTTGSLGYNTEPTSFFKLNQKSAIFNDINLSQDDQIKIKNFLKFEITQNNAIKNITANIHYFLSCKKIILVARGPKTTKGISVLMKGEVDLDFTLSLLLYNSDVTIIATNTALKELE